MNNINLAEINKEFDTKILAIYLIIAASILYLIMYHQEEAIAADKEFGTNYQSEYPNTDSFPRMIAIIFLIVNGIFLYYSYVTLQRAIERQNKTGEPASLAPYYLFLYTNILQFTATIIAFYNVFINDFGRVGITR